MTGLTNYITHSTWSDIFLVWYVLVDDAYKAVIGALPTTRLRCRGPAPHMSDSEVITVALVIDTLFGGNEHVGLHFVRQYHPDLFPNLLDNSRFNRRRRDLALVTEALRRHITDTRLIADTDRVRVVDNVPVPVCTYMRSTRCSTVAGREYCGVMVSRRAKLFGFRAYMSTTPEGVVDRWMLAPASIYDGKLTPALFEEEGKEARLWVLGDNAFHEPHCEAWLRADHQITLVSMPRPSGRNGRQKGDTREEWPHTVKGLFKRLRRRIESAFSVMCTVFGLEQLGSRSLTGLVARASSRILAYNMSFLLCHLLPLPLPLPLPLKSAQN